VEVQGAAEGWAAGLAGTEVHSADGATTVVRAADEQRLLDAARAAGRVTRFEPVAPTLAELFREAVGPASPGFESATIGAP
jgi:ABC-2 type transport system ATP-binding protein